MQVIREEVRFREKYDCLILDTRSVIFAYGNYILFFECSFNVFVLVDHFLLYFFHYHVSPYAFFYLCCPSPLPATTTRLPLSMSSVSFCSICPPCAPGLSACSLSVSLSLLCLSVQFVPLSFSEWLTFHDHRPV